MKKLYVAGGFVAAMGLAIVVTLAVVGKFNVGKLIGWVPGLFPEKVSKEASEYSAVFLANGQVYFGKLGATGDEYVSLTDVFYLRIQQQLQPPSEEDEEGVPKRETQLIKLGEELHGPVDEIKINRDQVLFIERMKTNSRVVQGIKKFYEQKK
ncbi:MAG: hypothetical protein A2784_00745 [Candidatus Chisholmbacteria bacterium RIFCSPHIGHO2_01_FULL_48_12]|uniref:Uncharacterized protein n=1 Tax=Candidatus Chisholmbacteria bacterium RIFCSPHIGHO2_01_FULL_48_12 TaxID=1797589 RepID=A0A1G1VL30_9BACT|nr:MAG: hypothetical protein A2784_00745 [Candidatus Chisholmbacteria bacterium RIFCSPHIGHO2_01_FULL_48_12]